MQRKGSPGILPMEMWATKGITEKSMDTTYGANIVLTEGRHSAVLLQPQHPGGRGFPSLRPAFYSEQVLGRPGYLMTPSLKENQID